MRAKRVGVADASLQPFAHRAQQFVTPCMTEPVVDLLEVVEVDEDQHERALADRLVEPMGEQQPVGQPGQRIVVHLMGEAVLRLVEPLRQLAL